MRLAIRRLTALAAAIGLAAVPLSPATAQGAGAEAVAGFESAGELLRKCRENSSFARNYCFAYLAAVADAARAYRVWTGGGEPCLPAGLTMGRLADTFAAYLIANPSQTEAQAASVIVASLQESFPCAPAPSPAPAPPAQAPAAVAAQPAPVVPPASGQGAPHAEDARPQQHGQP